MTDHAPEAPDAPEAPATVDHLIDALEAGGEKDSEGRFTLDAAVAREKLERFQLADPTRYVLMLLRAAVRQGATRADFEIDANELHLSFDGEPFPRSGLENLWGALLDGEGAAGPRGGLLELAVALTSAEAVGVNRMELRSGDGRSGAALRLGVESKPEVQPLPEGEVPFGTQLHLYLRGGARMVGRAMADYAGALPEERHLREDAVYAPLVLSLDGQRVFTAPEPEGLLFKIPVEDARNEASAAPAFRGVGGLQIGSQAPARLRIVLDGVIVEDRPLASPAPGFLAVVHADDLQTDLSQFHLLRDARWKRLLAATKRAQGEALLDLAARAQDRRAWFGLDRSWAREVLRQALGDLTDADAVLGEAADPVMIALAEVPLFSVTQTALTQPGRYGLRPLLEHAAQGGRVVWLDITAAEIVDDWALALDTLDERWCLYLPEEADRRYLQRLLGEDFRPLSETHPGRFARFRAIRQNKAPARAEPRHSGKTGRNAPRVPGVPGAPGWIVLLLVLAIAVLSMIHFLTTG